MKKHAISVVVLTAQLTACGESIVGEEEGKTASRLSGNHTYNFPFEAL